MRKRYGNKQKQRAYYNACNCLLHGYGRTNWNSCGLDEIEADEIWSAAIHDLTRF